MIPPWCTFKEVHPQELREQVPTVGILVEVRLLPIVEIPPRRRLPAGRFFGARTECSGPEPSEGPAERSHGNRIEMDVQEPISGNFETLIPAGCDLRRLESPGQRSRQPTMIEK